MALVARTRERRDPHEAPRLHTEVKGDSAAQEGRRKQIRRKRVARRHYQQAQIIVINTVFERLDKFMKKNMFQNHMFLQPKLARPN